MAQCVCYDILQWLVSFSLDDMKHFSFKAFAAVAFLHIAGTTWLVSATISRVHAYRSRRDIPMAHNSVVDLDARSRVAES
jgi:hypothetical protein